MNLTMSSQQQITHIAVLMESAAIIDPGSALALHQARRLARRTKGALTLLAFQPEQPLRRAIRSLLPTRSNWVSDGDHASTILYEQARRIQREDGVTVHADLRAERLTGARLRNWLAATPTDVLVMGKAAAGAVELATRFPPLLAETSTPLWIAEGHSNPGKGVVAAVSAEGAEIDGRAPADRAPADDVAMDAARGIGALFEAPIRVVEADGGAEQGRGPLGGAHDAAERVVREARSAGAGLIVAGVEDGHRWGHWLFGSVPDALVAASPCDVLLVHPAEPAAAGSKALLTGTAPVQTDTGASETDLLVNPRYHFTSPQSLLETEALTRGEKQLILHAWAEELENEIHQDQCIPQTHYEDPRGPEELDAVRRAQQRLRGQERAAA